MSYIRALLIGRLIFYGADSGYAQAAGCPAEARQVHSEGFRI